LKSLVTALESEGVHVASITPAAMLVVSAMNPSDAVARIREDDLVNVISMEHGAPRRWNLVTASEAPSREIDDSAARHGAKILAGAARPIIELRRDALAPADRLASVRGALTLLLASAAVLLL